MAWTKAIWDAEGWRKESACQDIDPELFFPVGATGDALAQIAVAKEVCASCPVVEECLIFAVTTNQEYGVWGGLDEEERRDVRRKWRRASRRVAPVSSGIRVADDLAADDLAGDDLAGDDLVGDALAADDVFADDWATADA